MIKYNAKTKSLEERLRKIPDFANNILKSYVKQDAVRFIEQYQENLMHDKFGLFPLIDPTIEQKQEKGYEQPHTPLYGAGRTESNSYYYMFLIREIKDGYKAFPRWAKHHESDLQLRDLLDIHEYGCTIPVTDKSRKYLHAIGIHLRKDTQLIRIPPRPVAFLTYRQILSDWVKRSRLAHKDVKKAVVDYLQDSKETAIKKMADRKEHIGREYERE